MKTCKIKDCEKKHYAKGWCEKHYCYALRHNGNPIPPKRKVGGISPDGYYRRKIKSKSYKVHRLIMQEHIGRELLASEHVHHINGDKLDNRIENLKIVKHNEHMGLHKKKHVINGKKECTKCKKWKEVKVNYNYSKKEERWSRWCKLCQKEYDRQKYLKK